jgi:hypothetical protein
MWAGRGLREDLLSHCSRLRGYAVLQLEALTEYNFYVTN